MTYIIVSWFVIIAGSILVGILCRLILAEKHLAIMFSLLLPWSVTLVFILYWEYNSADRELMQGSWSFFQATIGTIAAISGLLGAIIVPKLKDWRSNNSMQPTEKPAADRKRYVSLHGSCAKKKCPHRLRGLIEKPTPTLWEMSGYWCG